MKPKLVKELPLAERETLSCIFCNKKEDDEFLFGQFLTIGKQKLSLTVHYYCLLFASGLKQKGKDSQGIFGFLKKDILSAAERGKMIECHECHTTGATVVCSYTTCEKMFHFPCTSSPKMINQSFGVFNSFCIDHRPIQKVPDSFLGMNQSTCIICQKEVPTHPEPSYDLLWAPCCKKQSWFHRDCIQRLALSAGCHFFKCPICSNNELFLKEMQEMGIYVPGRDASWEAETNPFRNLYQRHNQCDHPTCICPRGRSYVGRLWKLVLCCSCGSKGLHISCGKLDPKRNEWTCENCRQVPVESSNQSRQNPSNTGMKAPSESAALKRPYPGRKEESSTSNNNGISEDRSEVVVVCTVAGPSNCAYSSRYDPKPSCNGGGGGAQCSPPKVQIVEQKQSGSGPLNRPLPQAVQNTIAVRAGASTSGTPRFSVADDGHQEVPASAASNQMGHTNYLVVDHQQERRSQADNQEEEANDQLLELMLCKSCGFIGLHTSYGKLDAQGNEWNCDNCPTLVAGFPGKSSSQSQCNPSTTGLKAPSESAAVNLPHPDSSETNHTNSSVVDHQQDRRIQADNQGEEAYDQAPPIFNHPTDLTEMNDPEQVGEVGKLVTETSHVIIKHPTRAIPPQTTASDQGPSPVDITNPPPVLGDHPLTPILNTLEGHFRLQDMGQIAEILMNHYSGDRDCPILKHLMLVLLERPIIALDGTPSPENEYSAGAITVAIINFIKQRVVSSRLDEFPKFKRLLLDLGLYAFLHLYEKDQKVKKLKDRNIQIKRKADNMLDTFQLAVSLLDISEELADYIENQPQLLLFAADCIACAGMKKGVTKTIKYITVALLFLEKFQISLKSVTDGELKANLIEQEQKISTLIRAVKSLPNNNQQRERAPNRNQIQGMWQGQNNIGMPQNSNYNHVRSGPLVGGCVSPAPSQQHEYAIHQAHDQAPPIVNCPTDLTEMNDPQQVGEVGELITETSHIIIKHHHTGAIPPQTTASDRRPSPADITDPPPILGDHPLTHLLDTLEGHFRLQDMGQIAEILMNHYSGNRDCPILKHLMLVLIKRTVIVLDGGVSWCFAGAITAAIINFIKQRVGSSKLEEFPKLKQLLLDLGLYAFLHLYERDQKLNGIQKGIEKERRKEDNMLDTYQLASSLLDCSEVLADCIENQPQLLLFAADCSARAGLKKGGIKYITVALLFLERFKTYLESVTDSESHLIEQEKKISELIRAVMNAPNYNELDGSDSDESYQVPSCKEPQAEVISPSKTAVLDYKHEHAVNKDQNQGMRQGQNTIGMIGTAPDCNYNLAGLVGSGSSAGEWVPPIPSQQCENAANRYQNQGMGQNQNNFGMAPNYNHNLPGSGPSAGDGFSSGPFQQTNWYQDQGMKQNQYDFGMPPNFGYNLAGADPSTGGGVPPIPIQQRQHATNWYQNQVPKSYGTSLDPEHPTGAVPPQTTASDQGLSPVDILNTLERHFRLQDMGQIVEILMNHYSGNRDCPILKDLMLVLIKRPVNALDGTKECSAGAITAEIINFIKQRVGSSRLDEFPKLKQLLLDLCSYAFLYLNERSKKMNRRKEMLKEEKEKNFLDIYRLASSLLDFSETLAECIENNPQLLLFVAYCSAQAGNKGDTKGIIVALFFLERFKKSLKLDMNSELKASLIKQEKKILEPIRSVKKLQNINDLGSGGDESHQVPSCKEAQAELAGSGPLVPFYQTNWCRNQVMDEQGQNNSGIPHNRNYNFAGPPPSVGGGIPPVPFQQANWDQNQKIRQDQHNFGMPQNYNYYHLGSDPSFRDGFSPANWYQNQEMGQGQYDFGTPPNFSYNPAGSNPSTGGGVPPMPSQQLERADNWNQNQGMWQGQNNIGMPPNDNYNHVIGSDPSSGKWVPPVPSQQHEHAPNWLQNQGMGHGQNNMSMPPYSSYTGEGSGPSSAYPAGDGLPNHQYEHAGNWNQNQGMGPSQNNFGMPHNRRDNFDGSGPSAGGGPITQWHPVPISQREQQYVINSKNPRLLPCYKCDGFGYHRTDCRSHGYSGSSNRPRPHN